MFLFSLTRMSPVTKRCRKLSGHNVVEGKDFKNTAQVLIHDDEYPFCVRL